MYSTKTLAQFCQVTCDNCGEPLKVPGFTSFRTQTTKPGVTNKSEGLELEYSSCRLHRSGLVFQDHLLHLLLSTLGQHIIGLAIILWTKHMRWFRHTGLPQTMTVIGHQQIM